MSLARSVRFALLAPLAAAGGIAVARAQLGPSELYPYPAETLVRLDFDADRFTDLAFVESSAIALARNAGDGSFFSAPRLVLSFSGRLAAVRADGDATRDLLVLGTGAPLAQAFLRTSAPGGFAPGAIFAVPAQLPSASAAIHVADLDRDGREDVLHGTASLLSNGDGTFHGRQEPWIAANGASELRDLDGDGFLDALSFSPSVGGATQLWIGWGSPQGFVTGELLPLPGARVGLPVSGDLDGDGRLDLACAGTSAAYLLFGAGARAFEPARSTPMARAAGPAVLGDFDGDGRVDLAFGALGSLTQVLQNRGGRSFLSSPAAGPASAQGAALIAVDLDEDGRDELVGGEGDELVVLWSLGGFAFRPEHRSGYPVERVQAFDLDRDGDLDLLAAGGAGASAHLQMLRNALDPASASFGTGTAGSGGFTPRLAARGGIARAGNLAFGFRVDQALGRTAGLLFVSSAATAIALPDGATLYVEPPFELELPLALAGRAGVGGDGVGQISVPIPLEAALVATDIFAQAALLDPARSSSLAWTAGLRVRLVP